MNKTQLITLTSSNCKRESHAILMPQRGGIPFSEQFADICTSFEELRKELGPEMKPVFMRWFLSDAANQAELLPEPICATSVIEQQPLHGVKVGLWAWFQEGVSVEPDEIEGIWHVRHGGYDDLFQAQWCSPGLHSATATEAMLKTLATRLEESGGTLLDNCLRTWFLVRDVDVNYSGVVSGRNEEFTRQGLTTDTHFLASTGIEGANADPTVRVTMDSISSLNVKPEQMRFLQAPEFLNPTYEYGVAFERGTAVDFGDRRHVYISGTASINNKGQVVHEGDVKAQTERMVRNVEELLKEAECDFSHVGYILVYLRDISDFAVVEEIFKERFPKIPHIILHAPVCRPKWLIEMECMAMKPVEAPYEAF